ncbi:MAG: hypothetical protein KIT80_11415 [Chitinophagaceae bacterium]|nr:hypothetical protein [Chitinophagaceae bacterium]MCW5927510.1 hypothetical protein [Chitinophagaceae bacterium]
MPGKREELFQYVLIIKKGEKTGNIDFISILICLICWLFFVFYSIIHQQFLSVLFIGSFLIPFLVARTILSRRQNKHLTFKHPLFACGMLWLFVPGMRWIALFFIVFILFDHQSRQSLEIGVSDERIVINTFFRKRYAWNEFSNVILRDNLLTLDFKNNRILQREIIPERSDVVEEEFNRFCREQLQNTADQTAL